jgi:DegV family protein with EDD domain
MTIGIVTDSVADIPEALVYQLGIHVVPYNVHWGAEHFKDGVDLLPGAFYKRLVSDPVLPTTGCPSAGDYVDVFETLAERCSSILSLHITSKGSGAYQSACLARDMLPRLDITPIDTNSVSMGTGFMAVEAARAARTGATKADVLELLKRLMEDMHQVFAADTLKYLYLGGRIGRAKQMLGALLNLKPLITMDRDGIIGPVGQALSRQGVYRRIVETMELWSGKAEPIKVALVQGAAEVEIAKLKALILSEFRCAEVLDCQFGPALGAHTGPGTVGVVFFRASQVHPQNS